MRVPLTRDRARNPLAPLRFGRMLPNRSLRFWAESGAGSDPPPIVRSTAPESGGPRTADGRATRSAGTAWSAGNRNSLARLRRAAASSDWSLLICERGSSPFHTFPPVTQAANKVRRHCSCARQYATTRQIAGTAWNADLRSAQRPAGPRRVEAQRPDDSRLSVDPKRRAARQTQELHFHDGQGCAGASDHGGFSRWEFHAGTARRQAGEKRKSASGGR